MLWWWIGRCTSFLKGSVRLNFRQPQMGDELVHHWGGRLAWRRFWCRYSCLKHILDVHRRPVVITFSNRDGEMISRLSLDRLRYQMLKRHVEEMKSKEKWWIQTLRQTLSWHFYGYSDSFLAVDQRFKVSLVDGQDWRRTFVYLTGGITLDGKYIYIWCICWLQQAIWKMVNLGETASMDSSSLPGALAF